VNGMTAVLKALHHGESELAKDLLTVAERHRTEHEVRHVAVDLARWSRIHTRRISEEAEHLELRLDAEPARPGGVLSTVREKTAEAIGHRPEPGLLLLRDLRDLCLAASGNSLYWEMLAQAAQAGRNRRLLDLATECHPQTLRQIRWANTMIKTTSPQILTAL
jgi:hypothetical protein